MIERNPDATQRQVPDPAPNSLQEALGSPITGEELDWDLASFPDRETANSPSHLHHSAWRHEAARKLAAALDPVRFGVHGLWLIGSVDQNRAGPRSDIDMVLYVSGDKDQKQELLAWIEIQDRALRLSFLRKTEQLLDHLFEVKLVDDQDLARQSSYAMFVLGSPYSVGTRLSLKAA